ncbi:hypothetical protein [Sphingobium subterraneum]|uniref:Uncharacterized protein n=1 Tax=Sphingobium subterraneum TaxID=627688 RepID=A0A841IVR7_9SPHN|nr:hypothetical protein [Sphingobium subterraneum]
MAPHPCGAVVALERRDDEHKGERIMLSLYGAEILSGFIMSARLTVPGSMPDEQTEGVFPARFHLSYGHEPTIALAQDGGHRTIGISFRLWDRLYAELCLVTAHARELARRGEVVMH